jgi:glycosyltransferase involved in cell wall biosynthesis
MATGQSKTEAQNRVYFYAYQLRRPFERASTMFSWDRIAEDLLKEYERLLV